MTAGKVLISLRRMQWQRAKGELLAVTETYWPEYRPNGTEVESGYERVRDAIKACIKAVDESL